MVGVGVGHAPLGAVRGGLGPALHSQFGQQRRHVVLHGLLGQEEPFADLPIREAVGDQFQDLSLARVTTGSFSGTGGGCPESGEELPGDRWIDERLPAGDQSNRLR